MSGHLKYSYYELFNPTTVRSFAEQIKPLHEDPHFLPWEHIKQTVLPPVFYTALALTVIYHVSFRVYERINPQALLFKKRKVSYQLTNLVANSSLGLVGLYFSQNVLPSDPTDSDMISGLNHIYLLSSLQIGYQLWSIPVGLFYVRETAMMLGHHVAVIVVSSMPAFLNCGFRYWTPFFFGILEISSVPLSVMNTFKDNPHWVQAHPTAYLVTRLIFAITFLVIRVYMLVPRKMRYLRDLLVINYTSESFFFRIYMSCSWMCSFALLLMQLYWAQLILAGFYKLLFGKPEKTKTV